MADLSNKYSALSAGTSRDNVTHVLDTICNASPVTITANTRANLINSLLSDLSSAPEGRLTANEAALAILAVKNLAKHPAGSIIIALPINLRLLLSFATAKYKDDVDVRCESLRCIANCLLLIEEARRTFIDENAVVQVGEEVKGGEVCLAELEKSTHAGTTFILSRILFLSTMTPTPFLRQAVESLNAVGIIGAKVDELTMGVVNDEQGCREAMTDLLKFTFNLLMHYPKIAGTPAVSPSDSELSSEERKVIGDYWSERLDGILPHLLLAFDRLPPTALLDLTPTATPGIPDTPTPEASASKMPATGTPPPAALKPTQLESPLTHIIHSLITIPITTNLKPVWFPASYPIPSLMSAENSASATSRSSTDSFLSRKEGKLNKDKDRNKAKKKSKSISPPRSRQSTSDSLAISSPSSRPSSPYPPGSPSNGDQPQRGKGALDRALSVLSSATRRSLSRSPTPSITTEVQTTTLSPLTGSGSGKLFNYRIDTVSRVYALLMSSLEFYLPGDVDPDSEETRDRLQKLVPPAPPGSAAAGPGGLIGTESSLDDPIAPLLLLVSRMCLGDAKCRKTIRGWLLPKDMDRTSPLETQRTPLGTLIRLLSSIYHPRSKDAAGELLYAASNSDPYTLSALVGYGNVAGFLFNKGVLSAPAAPTEATDPEDLPDGTGSDEINPITGVREDEEAKKAQAKSIMDEMTEEEKEREMDKLFHLFDRLERSGAIKPEGNPVRAAMQKSHGG